LSDATNPSEAGRASKRESGRSGADLAEWNGRDWVVLSQKIGNCDWWLLVEKRAEEEIA